MLLHTRASNKRLPSSPPSPGHISTTSSITVLRDVKDAKMCVKMAIIIITLYEVARSILNRIRLTCPSPKSTRKAVFAMNNDGSELTPSNGRELQQCTVVVSINFMFRLRWTMITKRSHNKLRMHGFVYVSDCVITWHVRALRAKVDSGWVDSLRG